MFSEGAKSWYLKEDHVLSTDSVLQVWNRNYELKERFSRDPFLVEKGENLKLQILTSGRLSIPAEPTNFGQMETTKGTSAEHEMGVGWTQEVGLLRKT